MEAQAELGRHLDLSLEQPAGAGRKYIVVIGGGGAATERELGESDLGGGPPVPTQLMTPPSISNEPFSSSVPTSSMVTTTRQLSSRIIPGLASEPPPG